MGYTIRGSWFNMYGEIVTKGLHCLLSCNTQSAQLNFNTMQTDYCIKFGHIYT